MINGLVMKPHFDKGVFKMGRAINVTFPKNPHQVFCNSYDCIIQKVEKDTLVVCYLCEIDGCAKFDRRTIYFSQ